MKSNYVTPKSSVKLQATTEPTERTEKTPTKQSGFGRYLAIAIIWCIFFLISFIYTLLIRKEAPSVAILTTSVSILNGYMAGDSLRKVILMYKNRPVSGTQPTKTKKK